MAKLSNTVSLEMLEMAVARLPPMQREILFLSAAEGLALDAIAARLGRSPAQVERDLAKALCKIDRWLERQERPWWKFW